MSSGIQVMQAVKDTYIEMKTKKLIPWFTMKIVDAKTIEVDQVGVEGSTFEDFHKVMLAARDNQEGRYAVFDVKDEKNHGKLLFIYWSDDNSVPIKMKMLYASSKSNCIKALEGQTKELQCNDADDLSLERFQEQVGKK